VNVLSVARQERTRAQRENGCGSPVLAIAASRARESLQEFEALLALVGRPVQRIQHRSIAGDAEASVAAQHGGDLFAGRRLQGLEYLPNLT
jgi:hypothetical protein